MTMEERQTAYIQRRKSFLKNKEREANDYRRGVCRSTEKYAMQNRNTSQRYE